MQGRTREHLIATFRAALAIVDLRVDMILDQVVTLPVQSIGSTTLLVHERVPGYVSRQMAHPTERIGLEAIVPGLVGLLPQVPAELVGLAVMEHVAPEKGLFVVAIWYPTSKQAEYVVLLEQESE